MRPRACARSLASEPFPMTDEPTILRCGTETVRVAPGSSATFGRSVPPSDAGTGRAETIRSDTQEAHLGLSENQRLHAFAGRLSVDPTGWTVENIGRWLHIRVSSPGQRNHIDLEPGRAVRGPWARAVVEITTGDELVALEIDCPTFDAASATEAPYVASSGTIAGLDLDRNAGYFLAAVALCEPRLRDPSSDEIATIDGVARTLTKASGARVTTKAAERRLAHLRSKIGIGADALGGSAAGLEVRDASRQTAELLIRTGVVTAEDLRLLDPPAEPSTWAQA